MKKSEQRGVALLFALGMLSLLLVSGLAFVANSLTARKIAANNSNRSQARIFAQSALSRALASIMMYQYQVKFASDEFPETFERIRSEGSDKDGLQASAAESLLALPSDDTVVAKNLALQYNSKLERFDGGWVYFYNTYDKDSDDRMIIGRAAWQVISDAPQISAPMFFSGHLQVDDGWTPENNRWGIEIDEVFTANSTIFKNVRSRGKDFKMPDYNAIFTALGLTTDADADKRWIENWFIPDESSDGLGDAAEIIPEVYQYESSNGKTEKLMRFNISEVEGVDKYGITNANADQWYARFGIDSTTNSEYPNTEKFLTDIFTRDSGRLFAGDEFDYKIEKDDRPGLPFLRRIGAADDGSTFKKDDDVDFEAWRKQIAANFNDYCDADSIPTSDIAPAKWMDAMSETYTHPKFTGNEKTPYIYELGFRMGIYPEKDGKADISKTSLVPSPTVTGPTGTLGTYTASLANTYVGLAPIVKLANIYDFNPSEFSNFAANVDLGAFEVKFKPIKVKLEINYTRRGTTSTAVVEPSDTMMTTLNFSTLTATVDDNVLQTLKVENTDNTLLDNTAGANPYPMLIPDGLKSDKEKTVRLNFANDGKFTFNCSTTTARTLLSSELASGGGLGGITGGLGGLTATINKVTVKSIDAIEIVSVKLKMKRAVLSATYNGQNIGLDYVRTLPDLGFSTEIDTGSVGGLLGSIINRLQGKNLKLSEQDGAQIPGIYIGGIRNYDPRQNLNPDDWYKTLTAVKSDDIRNPKDDSALSDVIYVNAENKVNDGDSTAGEADKFNPSFASINNDKESVTAPARTADKHLSTAFIRNAPMMSPWEIGLIHRGVRWQTINIKNSCDPANNSSNITPAGHAPHNNSWTLSGTKYGGESGFFGDAAILDQIKMTDKCVTYGKINVNRLRKDSDLFDKDRDYNIAQALFENIRFSEDISKFYKNSTRKADYSFPTAENTGTPLDSFTTDDFDKLTASRKPHKSRAEFIAWTNGDMENAFGAASITENDAGMEEIIGKTANLLCAETSSPSQIKVVIVAQAIRDVGGMQVRNGKEPVQCKFGKFDYDNGIYYDEITGEVKMLVTIDRDITTGRMSVRRIDYLE